MRILAVDYGDARTGLAICDRGELLASPVGVFHSGNREAVIEEIARQVAEQRAELVVVGNPLNMNGTAGPRSELCHALADDLAKKLPCPVKMWDERSTTVTATQYLNMTDVRGKKRKNTIDAVAATIILESYLAYRKKITPGRNEPCRIPKNCCSGKRWGKTGYSPTNAGRYGWKTARRRNAR